MRFSKDIDNFLGLGVFRLFKSVHGVFWSFWKFLWGELVTFEVKEKCFHFTTCGAKESGNPGPLHIKPKAHVEEEEMSEDERRRSELPGDVVEGNPILSKPRSRREKAARH